VISRELRILPPASLGVGGPPPNELPVFRIKACHQRGSQVEEAQQRRREG
jgi:hypothetical protein